MLVYAGIDEAGYGPMLGPLAVACSVFMLEHHDPEEGSPNLWRELATAVCRAKKDKKRRIAVDDSKKLKGANDGSIHPLKHLERGVLSFAARLDAMPADDVTLLEALGASVPERRWYEGETDVPVAQTADELRIASNRLGRCLERARISIASMRCELTDADEFNKRCDTMGNKANVNIGCVMRLADEVWRKWPDAHPRVIVDRQGGRTHYRDELQVAWPDASIRIVAESETLCRYHLTDGGRELTISFAKEAELKHLPVALASMTAKYSRELLMHRLNRFFGAKVPELKPTAGYVQDARRWLDDVAPVVREMGIRREELVRKV